MQLAVVVWMGVRLTSGAEGRRVDRPEEDISSDQRWDNLWNAKWWYDDTFSMDDVRSRWDDDVSPSDEEEDGEGLYDLFRRRLPGPKPPPGKGKGGSGGGSANGGGGDDDGSGGGGEDDGSGGGGGGVDGNGGGGGSANGGGGSGGGGDDGSGGGGDDGSGGGGFVSFFHEVIATNLSEDSCAGCAIMQDTLLQAYAHTVLSFGLEEPPSNTTTLLMQVSGHRHLFTTLVLTSSTSTTHHDPPLPS